MTIAAQAVPEFDNVVRLKVSWATYNILVQEIGDHRGARLTYDGETLEIMSPGTKHEFIANIIAAMIDAVSVEWSINLTNFGSATFGAEPRGFEADKAYYLDAGRRLREFENIDLTLDPPPDLVVEVDITSSSSRRMETYAALGVPEVWRFKSDHFAILQLHDARYAPCDVSGIVRGLPATEVAKRIQAGTQANGETLTIRAEWQRWLRANRKLHESA